MIRIKITLYAVLLGFAAAALPGGDSLAGESATPTASPGDNASFFVIGKTWHFQQDSSGLHGPNDVHYFAEIFSKAGGKVSDGSMRLLVTGAETIPFDHESDNGAVLHARDGKIHLNVADLDAELPTQGGAAANPLETPNPLVEPGKPSASWLTYTATQSIVPGAGLIPGMSYRLEVEIAKLMDTDRREGVVGMSTYAATTHLNIPTAGAVKPGACPQQDEA